MKTRLEVLDLEEEEYIETTPKELGDYIEGLLKGDYIIEEKEEISIRVRAIEETLSKKALSKFLYFLLGSIEVGEIKENILEYPFIIFLRELEERIRIGETIRIIS